MRTQFQKAQPTASDVHVNAPLTNISVAYIQDQSLFVADRVFPVVPVQNQSNLYYIFNKEDFLRDEAKPRAPSTESAGGGFNLTTASYAAIVEAFHKDVDDQVRANADSVLSLDTAATKFVTQKLLIRRERRWVASYFTTGVWGTDITPGTLWSAAAGTPRADVEVGKMAIAGSTGLFPNKLVMGAQVFSALRNSADVRDQFKYTSADSIDEAMLARYFGVDEVLVLKSVFSSSAEGATAATGFTAGKHALLTYTTDAPSLMQPTAGYLFAWAGYTGAINGLRMKRYRMDPINSDRIEGEIAYDMKVVAPALGYFFNSVVA